MASLSEKPGDPAVTADGRLVFTMHPLNRPTFKLMERKADGTVVPFPDPEASRTAFDNPLGIRAARDGTLWILDMGDHAGAAAWPATRPPRLVGWDPRAQRRRQGDPAAGRGAAPELLAAGLRDRRDARGRVRRGRDARRSHPGRPAGDHRRGPAERRAARRLLEGHPSFEPAPLPAATVHSGLLTATGADGRKHTIRFGLDPITIDVDDEWVYWGPGNGLGIYRARAADLADPALPAAELAGRVERYRGKPPSDGISIDREGNVYVTDVGEGAVGVSTADGYRVLARDPRMIWPDGLAFGPDGLLYVTISQFGRMPLVNDGQDKGQPPYVVLRLRPLAPSAVGR